VVGRTGARPAGVAGVSAEPNRAERLADLAQDALLAIMETGTTSQKILVLPLIVPRPLPEKPKAEHPGGSTFYFLTELDENGEPVEMEKSGDGYVSKRKPPGPDGVTRY
jgi:hypothetical protein